MRPPIENVDVFSVELPASGDPAFTNPTLSSGDALPPFGPGSIDPSVLHVTPSGRILIHDDGGEDLLGLSPDGDFDVLVPAVKSMEFVELVGDVLVAGVRRSFDPRPKELYALAPGTLGAALLHSDSPDEDYLRPNVSHGRLAFVARDEGTAAERLFRVDPFVPQVEVLATAAAAFTPPLAIGRSGSVLVAEDPPLGPKRFVLWRPGGGLEVVAGAPVQGHALPGR